MGFSAKPGGPVWSRYSGTVLIGLELIWFFTFTSIFPGALFQALVIYSENKKAALLVYGRTAEYRELGASALFENEKAGILMASHHKNPGRFPNDKFLKTL